MKETEPSQDLIPLPDLRGRVAVLGGSASAKTELCVSLALRQVHQDGLVLCLDARRSRHTAVQFHLGLRGNAHYIPLPPSEAGSAEISQTVLKTISHGLRERLDPPPLLVLDNVREHAGWEQTLSFLLKAGVTVVEFLPSVSALVFGRYDTVLLLRAEANTADALSRAVGRKVSQEEVLGLESGRGWLIHLAQRYQVRLPRISE